MEQSIQKNVIILVERDFLLGQIKMHNVKHAYVYCNNKLAGHLLRNRKRYVFIYDKDYVGPSIAINFPKSTRYYSSPYLFPYFYGLLPEGENKEFYCRAYHLNPDDNFEILTNLAWYETIGPVTVRSFKNG